MKNLLQRFLQKNLNRLTWILVLAAFGFFGSPVGAQITGTSPASRCGEGQLVLHATASSGIITWYSVPFYGTSVATGGTFTTPSLVVTTTYYVDAVDDNGCSLNPGSVRVPVIATISANSIQATIFYESSTFCASVTEPQLPTRTGTAGGTYTADPVTGLDLDPSTGAIIPSESANGTYTVTYTVIPAEGCIENPASTTVTITNAPEQPVIAYSGSPFCTTSGPVTVSLTGATGGTFSATPTGLTIHSGTGTITPSSSFTGTYTISYFVPGTGGCSPMTATTTASILQLPTASISYNSPFTKNQGVQSVTLTGSGVYTGGTYSSTAGLTLNPSTGAITPSTSTTGTYTVTYTLAAVAPCAGVTATTSVTIYPLPTATVSGTTTVCKNSTDPSVTFTGSDGTPPYTFTYNINGGTDLSVTTTSGNSVAVTQLTDIAGTYAYNLLRVTDSHGSWQDQSGTATVTVTEPNVGNFIYAATPYCSNSTDPLPQFEGSGMAGVFSSTTGLVFVSTSTGEVDLSASTAGTYTVTNTIAATGGCPLTTYTASLTITQLPVAGFTYASDTYCTNGTDPTPILGSGATAGIFTSSPAGVVFVSSSTGQIDLSASTPGSYTIYNTIDASAGCPEVSASFGLSIGAPPTEPHIAYSSASFCTTITSPQPVELTGTTGGTFTASPSGLTIHASTGAITPSTSTPNAYTVTYTVGGGSGCSALTATTEVEILEAPTVTNATTKTICSNTSTDIDLTASINSTFAWTLGLVSTSISNAEPGTGDYIDQTLINADYNNTGEAPYIITATSTENGCASNTLTITVTVRPAVALVITNPAAVCYPNTVDITAPAVTAGSASGLTFSYTDAGGSPVANPEAVAVSGYYYIRGTTAQGCYEISPASVTINPLPIAPTAENTTVTFDGNSHSASASAPSGAHVSWYDAATGGSPAAAPTATNAGTYTAYAESVDNTTGCVSATRTLVTLEIDQAMLTVTADPQTKVYGASNPTLTFQYSGWQNGDDASDLTTPPTASTTVDLTTGVGVHDDAITVSGGGDDNYDFTYVAADFTITKAMLTVTADPQTKIYGEANPTLTFQYSGWQNGDDASDLTTPPTASTTVTAASGVNVYDDAITVSGGADDNYDFTYVAADFTVTQAMLTVTADPQTKVYGEANPTLTFQYSGWMNGDDEADLTTPPIAATTVNLTTGVGVHDDAITVSGGIDDNYDFTYMAADFTVTQAMLTVTADPQTKVYGEGNPVLTYQITGWENGDDEADLITPPTASTLVTAVTGAGVHDDAITVGGGADDNYDFTYIAADFTITKAMLTVTADEQSKVYGEGNPVLTYEITGWQNGDDEADLTTPPIASTTVNLTTGVGVHDDAITVSGGADDNYNFTYVAADFTVNQAMLTVTADPQTKVYGEANPTLTFQYSGWQNGDDASDLTTQPTASTTVTLTTGAGVYDDDITVSGGVDDNYDFTYVAATFTVTQALLTVTADPQSKVYGDVNPTLTYVITGWQNGDDEADLTSGPIASTTVNENTGVGVHHNVITVSDGDDDNYDFAYEAADFTITKATLTVTADPQTKVYGESNPALTIQYSGWQNVDNEADLTTPPTASTTVTASTGAGVHADAITVSSGVDDNYAFSYVAADFTVTKATLTVTADAKSKVSGAANPPLTFQYSGWLNGDDATDLTTVPTASTTVTLSSPAGVYEEAITVSGGVDNDYTFDYVAADFTVYPPAPTGDASQTFCSGSELGDVAITGETGATFTWYDAASGGNILPGSTTLDNSATYHATQTTNSVESVDRLAVTTTVNALSVAGDAPSPVTVDAESQADFYTDNGTGTIQWQVSTDDGSNWTDVADDDMYDNVTSSHLIINGVTTEMSGYLYRAVFTNGVCTGAPTSAAALTVNPI